MSMISNLVEKLREYGSQRKGEISSLTLRAADTIEMLSEKARADRPQGEWIKTTQWSYGAGMGEVYGYCQKCSNCGKEFMDKSNFCPNCGAKMVNGEGGE